MAASVGNVSAQSFWWQSEYNAAQISLAWYTSLFILPRLHFLERENELWSVPTCLITTTHISRLSACLYEGVQIVRLLGTTKATLFYIYRIRLRLSN